jgi:hypothetical protein
MPLLSFDLYLFSFWFSPFYGFGARVTSSIEDLLKLFALCFRGKSPLGVDLFFMRCVWEIIKEIRRKSKSFPTKKNMG